MCQIFSISKKQTCTYTRARIVRLAALPHHDGIVAVWYCNRCERHMIDIAHVQSQYSEFLKHIFRNESRGNALTQLRLWENE